MPRSIPRGWRELAFKDFLKFTPRAIDKPRAKYLSLGIRSHCKGTFVREVENPDKVMMETLYEVKRDDLIVNITFAWEGAVALIKESDEGALVSHRFPTYVFDCDMVIPEYFKYLIPSKRFVYELGVISPGGAGRNRVLDRTDFLDLRFVMPPFEEQKRIAEILETWDRTIEKLDKLIKDKTRLKKGLMQKIMNGESGEKIRLKDVAKIIPSNVDKKNYEGQREVSLCNYLDVYNNSYITNKLPFMRATASEAELRKFSLSVGDVVITKDSETPEDIGVPSVVSESLKNVVCGYHLAIIRPDKNKVNSIYLAKAIQTLAAKKQFYRFANGATRFGLAVGDIGKIEFFAPNVKVQMRAGRIFKALDNEIYLLVSKCNQLRFQKIGLTQRLLTGKIRVKGCPK